MYRKISLIMCGLVILVWAGIGTQGYGQDAPYRMSDKEMKQLLERLEDNADKLRKSVDKALDKSRLDTTRREDDINKFLKDFEDATDRLKDRFEDHKSVAADVEEVLRRAAFIDRFMQRQRLSAEVQGDWAAVKADLDELARAYNVSWQWERTAR